MGLAEREAQELRRSIKAGECFCPLANAAYTNMLLHTPTVLKVAREVGQGRARELITRGADRVFVSDGTSRMNARNVIDELPPGPVLVTGATGFLGRPLVQRLRDSGVPTRALVRNEADASRLASAGVDVIVGDIGNDEAVAKAVEGVVVVFHLAGKLFAPGQSPQSTTGSTSRNEADRRVLPNSAATAPVRALQHDGSPRHHGSAPPPENAPLRPTNVYEETKAEAELAVLEACERGLPAVVARPGLVYGPGDLHLVGFFRAVVKRRFRPIGREPVWLHPIYIDDMTDVFLRCAAACPDALGERFNLAGPEPVSLERLAGAIARAAGRTPAGGRIPMSAARALAAAGNALPSRLQHAAPLTKSRLDFLTHSRVYSVEKAARVLGFVAPTELSDGMTRSVTWYREHGYLPA